MSVLYEKPMKSGQNRVICFFLKHAETWVSEKEQLNCRSSINEKNNLLKRAAKNQFLRQI